MSYSIEQKIANAIYEECGEHFSSIEEFCKAYGFSSDEFLDFLQHGINAMKAFRVMDKYYSKEPYNYD